MPMRPVLIAAPFLAAVPCSRAQPAAARALLPEPGAVAVRCPDAAGRAVAGALTVVR